MGYTSSPDVFNPKFAGQMRDRETGLDYMGFRYYSPQQGRFITVDPGNAGADPANPQTWNGYAYVGNNPLNLTDSGGESWFSVLAGVIVGIATLNPAIGAEVAGLFTSFENVMSGNPPEAFGFNAGLGGLTGCGGPLGNCGTLGAGPWSELTGLGDVQDPDRFISDAQKAQQPASNGKAASLPRRCHLCNEDHLDPVRKRDEWGGSLFSRRRHAAKIHCHVALHESATLSKSDHQTGNHFRRFPCPSEY